MVCASLASLALGSVLLGRGRRRFCLPGDIALDADGAAADDLDLGVPSPRERTASRAWATDTWGAGTSQAVPPLKSMPKLRPRVNSETRPMRMTAPEIRNQRFLRPMKSMAVSPW